MRFDMGWVAIAFIVMFFGMLAMGGGGAGFQKGFERGMSRAISD